MSKRSLKAAALLLAVALVAGCGSSSKPKEELLKEGQKLIGEKNSRGAVVLFKNALDQDPNYFEARFQLAKAYYNLGNFDSAEKELQKVVRQNPSLGDAKVDLAKILVQKGKPDEALAELSELIKEGSANAEALEVAGWAYAAKEDYGEAARYIKASIAASPERAEGYVSLARAYAAKGDKAAARAQIAEALKRDGSNAIALHLQADLQLGEGDKKGALETFDRIIAKNPADLMASFRKGTILVEGGNHKDALALASTMIEKFGGRAEGHKLKAIASMHAKDLEQAIASFQKSLSISPDPGSYYFLGLCHYQKGEAEQATSQFQKALDLMPSFTQSRTMLAMAHLKLGRVDDAVNEAKKVLEADSSNALAHNILGSAYLAKGDQERGIAELNRAIDLDPGLVDAHIKKGLYNLGKGRAGEAEAELKAAVEIAPEIMSTRLLLATHYARSKQFAKAREILAKGVKGGKADAPLLSMTAEIQLQEGKVEDAVKNLEKAKQADPDFLQPYFALSTVYMLSGKQDKGIEELKAVLQRSPKNLQALLAMASVMEAKGNTLDSEQYYGKISELGTFEGYMAISSRYISKGEFGKAAGYLEKAIEKDPSNPAPYEAKGKALMNEKKYKEAVAEFERLEKVNARAGFIYRLNAYVAMGRPEEAVSMLEKQIAREPESMELVAETARIYMHMGKTDAARAAAEQIIKKRPSAALGYTVLAMVHQGGKDEARALEALKKAASVEPKNLNAHMMLGAYYTAKREHASALESYRRAEKAAPGNPLVVFQQASVLEQMGRRGEAAGEYQRTLRIAPNHVPALNNLAYIYSEEKSGLPKAVQAATKAYVLAPRDAAVMDTFGYVLAKSGRYEQAEKLLSAAAAALPGNPSVLYHLAFAQKGMGNASAAAANLEKALSRGEFPEAGKAREMLAQIKNGKARTSK